MEVRTKESIMAQGYGAEGAGRLLTGFMSGKAQKQQEVRNQEMVDLQKQALKLDMQKKENMLELMNRYTQGQGGGQMPPMDDPTAISTEQGVEQGGQLVPQGGGGFGDMFSEDIMKRMMSKELTGIDTGRPQYRPVPMGDRMEMYKDGDLVETVHKPRWEIGTATLPDKSEVSFRYDLNKDGDYQAKKAQAIAGPLTKPPATVAKKFEPIPDNARQLYRHKETGGILPRGFNVEQADKGGYKEFPKADIDAADNLAIKALPVINNIMESVEVLWPGVETGLLQRGKQAFKVAKERLTQDDPRYTAFIDGMNMFTALLARSVSGEVGVLTDNDIKRITKAMPAWDDSPGAAKQKMNQVLDIVQKRIDSRGISWIKLPPKFELGRGKPSLGIGGNTADSYLERKGYK